MNLSDIFQKLEIESNSAVIYFHIYSDMIKDIADIKGLFSFVDYYFDKKSTVCMPSFPFTGGDYYDYLIKNPVFDVRKTPCRTNLISEIFRRKENVIRSIHPWCSVACKGYYATEFTYEHHKDIKTFGEKSPFWKIIEAGGYVVGLGVDCNTNSFAHMPDDKMKSLYDFRVYEENLFNIKCLDYDGNELFVQTDCIERSTSKAIKPRIMKEFLKKECFYKELNFNGINFYSMKLKDFVDFSVNKNMDIVKEKKYPLYYLREKLTPIE